MISHASAALRIERAGPAGLRLRLCFCWPRTILDVSTTASDTSGPSALLAQHRHRLDSGGAAGRQ
jgi:hypothetical protein